MVCFDYIRVLQVSDSAGQLENAVEGTGGKVELLHGRFKQFSGWFFRLAKLPDLGGGHFSVTAKRRARESVELPGTGGLDPVLNRD